MDLGAILAGGGIGLLGVLALIQFSPIKVNPWSAIARWLGRNINADVLTKLNAVETELTATKQKLDEHVTMDDERNADLHRARILQFNTELLRGILHTEEDFNEIMYNITTYEHYCEDHPKYQNNRAVRAIKNINRVFDERMEKHDFL